MERYPLIKGLIASTNMMIALYTYLVCVSREEGKMGMERKCSHIEYVHYSDVLMGAMASQITSLTIVYSTVYSDADERKHQSSHWPLWGECTGDWPVTWKMFPFDDIVMPFQIISDMVIDPSQVELCQYSACVDGNVISATGRYWHTDAQSDHQWTQICQSCVGAVSQLIVP